METCKQISEIEYKTDLISVVVPVFNLQDYISDCIDSILNQNYLNIEIIIVDDGSTDKSDVIADIYHQKFPDRIKVIHTQNNGVAQARLTGIKAANGKWIGFVDGDDIIEPDMYERLLDNAVNNNADISHCGYQTIVNNGERIHYFYNTGKKVLQDNMTGLKDLVTGSFVEPGLWNKLFRRQLFDNLIANNLMDMGIRYSEDFLMNYLLFSQSKLSVYEDFCPYHYMSRNTSATRSEFNANKIFDPLKVYKRVLDEIDTENKDVAWAKYLACLRGAYEALYKKTAYKNECREIKNILINNKSKWDVLNKKEKMKLILLLNAPMLYKAIYKFYEKYFQRKIYE